MRKNKRIEEIRKRIAKKDKNIETRNMENLSANELRINNWFNSVKFNTPVYLELSDLAELYYRCYGAEIDSDIIADFITPIELTEKWLIKSEYEEEIREWKGNGQDWQPETAKTKQIRYELKESIYLVFEYFDYRAKETDPWMRDRNIFIEYHGDSIYLTNYYIHTLQNLFHSLTGNELKLQ